MPEIIESTVEAMLAKTPRQKKTMLSMTSPDGKEVQMEILMRAIGSTEYDDLVAKHPPKKGTNSVFDIETFGPALLSECLVVPPMSIEQAQAIWESPAWSGGEIVGLFNECLELNMAGLNVPFTAGA